MAARATIRFAWRSARNDLPLRPHPSPVRVSRGAMLLASWLGCGCADVRPFFSYYGAKWTGAKYYGSPRHGLVIEPFAGSASYSTRWDCPRVKLYDVCPEVCDLWAWLIGCSVADVERIPCSFESYDEVRALPRGPQLLVRFWISKGRAEPSQTLSPWYFQWRNANDCRVWSSAVKRRIMHQKPIIERWTIEQKPYWEIDFEEAHWHVDPPYSNDAGARYPYSEIDFQHLAAWCCALPGSVDVCENVGATWLPFEPLYEVVTSRGRRSGAVSKEAVWRR